MNGVLCFGEALIDFHQQAPSNRLASSVFLPHAGGAPANVAVAVARLGGRSGFIGMLARDMFADLLLQAFADAGVDITHVARTDAANTALAFVSHDSEGERRFSFYRPPAADLLFRDSDFTDDVFVAGNIFHTCSNSLTETAIAAATVSGMTRARAAGALVSFDMNLRPALWAPGEDPGPRLWRALEQADLVKLSAEELAFLASAPGSEQAVLERLWHNHTKCLVITDGAKPLRWLTPCQHGELPVFSLAAVDTTAAGDAFVGGLLYCMAEMGTDADTLPEAIADDHKRTAWLRFASACGALTVTRAGAFAAMPKLTEVHALLESRP